MGHCRGGDFRVRRGFCFVGRGTKPYTWDINLDAWQNNQETLLVYVAFQWQDTPPSYGLNSTTTVLQGWLWH